MLEILPVLDSKERAEHCSHLLTRNRFELAELAQDTLKITKKTKGYDFEGQRVELKDLLEENLQHKKSIPPEEKLELPKSPNFSVTKIQFVNETTLMTARRLMKEEKRALVLNFANGTNVGGGFLVGARAQEETLCYASSLYMSLEGDPFYRYHRFKSIASSNYAIVSETVVFRDDEYNLIREPWQMDVITMAAPIAIRGVGVSKKKGAQLLDTRIERLYEIAASLGYEHLVLGAWGCGAFGNDPAAVSSLFRKHLEGRFTGCFSEVIFTIADWSPERKFLHPFVQSFSTATAH